MKKRKKRKKKKNLIKQKLFAYHQIKLHTKLGILQFGVAWGGEGGVQVTHTHIISKAIETYPPRNRILSYDNFQKIFFIEFLMCHSRRPPPPHHSRQHNSTPLKKSFRRSKIQFPPSLGFMCVGKGKRKTRNSLVSGLWNFPRSTGWKSLAHFWGKLKHFGDGPHGLLGLHAFAGENSKFSQQDSWSA